MSKIGLTQLGLKDFETLDIPEPNVIPKPYHESILLGSGGKKGRGFPSIEMQWGALHNTQRATLRGYCATESGNIFVEITDPEDDTSTIIYSGKINWPDEEDPQIRVRVGFSLMFTNLVEVEPELL